MTRVRCVKCNPGNEKAFEAHGIVVGGEYEVVDTVDLDLITIRHPRPCGEHDNGTSGWYREQFEVVKRANPFKKGDRVRLVRPCSGDDLLFAGKGMRIGDMFTVVENNDGWVRLQVDGGRTTGWYPDQFELVAPPFCGPVETEVERLKRIHSQNTQGLQRQLDAARADVRSLTMLETNLRGELAKVQGALESARAEAVIARSGVGMAEGRATLAERRLGEVRQYIKNICGIIPQSVLSLAEKL